MDLLEACARELWLAEHKGSDPAMWGRLARKVQISYASRAAGMAMAAAMVTENH